MLSVGAVHALESEVEMDSSMAQDWLLTGVTTIEVSSQEEEEVEDEEELERPLFLRACLALLEERYLV